MSFGGSTDTAALVTLGSLGCIDARTNKKTSAVNIIIYINFN